MCSLVGCCWYPIEAPSHGKYWAKSVVFIPNKHSIAIQKLNFCLPTAIVLAKKVFFKIGLLGFIIVYFYCSLKLNTV